MPPSYEPIPVHELLSESETAKVAKKFGISLDKFPKINEGDPQAKKIGAKAGQLVAIHREDPTGKYTYYRYVVR
ncbi:MAG: DNA-directed RNA polymerase subunit H [Candidatus Marsarchaeota archaeon]|nr:DNA-directed RNA polymerase subunit H [Candidatus Marsarchaeota archaeon]